MRRVTLSLMLTVIAAALHAQSLGPVAGTWGGEGTGGFGGALLRFQSDATARIIGLGLGFSHDDDAGSFGGDRTNVSVRLGVRRYSRLADKTRPYRTLFLVSSYSNLGSTLSMLSAGMAAEFGVAHFFTPHVSLGVSGELNASITRERSAGFGPTPTTITNGYSLTFYGFRVLGGVYF